MPSARAAASSSRLRVSSDVARSLAVLAARHAQQRHRRAEACAPREEAAGRDRFVVGMGEDRQQGAAVEIKIGQHALDSQCTSFSHAGH